MRDVLLFQGPDGGEIELKGGIVTLTESPFNPIYISLFGGNLDDSGATSSNSKQWWGNFGERDEARHIRSRTQHLLISLPAISSNLKVIEEAVQADLAWMVGPIAKSFTVSASLPARRRCRIQVDGVDRDGSAFSFDVTQPWGPQ